MKRVLIVIMSIAVIVSLCACGATNSGIDNNSASDQANNITRSAIIIDNEGNRVQKSATELVEIYNGNQAKFNKLYRGASITFTGTVKEVKTSIAYNSNAFYDMIFFEEGWVVRLPENKYTNILANIDVGGKVYVDSDINSCSGFGNEVDIRGMAEDNIGFDDESLNSTIIKVV